VALGRTEIFSRQYRPHNSVRKILSFDLAFSHFGVAIDGFERFWSANTMYAYLMSVLNIDEDEGTTIDGFRDALAFWYGGQCSKSGDTRVRRAKFPGVKKRLLEKDFVWGEGYNESEEGRKAAKARRLQVAEHRREADAKNAARVLEAQQAKEKKAAEKKAKKAAKKAARAAKRQKEAGPDAVVLEGLGGPDADRPDIGLAVEQISELEAENIEKARLQSVGGDGYMLTRPDYDPDGETGADLRPQAEQWAEFAAAKNREDGKAEKEQADLPVPKPKKRKRSNLQDLLASQFDKPPDGNQKRSRRAARSGRSQ
jgi:hypothetical protein